MQIQQGMERLRTAAPDVFQSLGLPSLPPNLVPQVPPVPSPAQPSPAAPAGNEQVFNQFMSQMMGQMRAGNPDQPPEERWATFTLTLTPHPSPSTPHPSPLPFNPSIPYP